MVKQRFIKPIIDGIKIHTIRSNYEFWIKHDNKECSIRVWEGKPYHSKQIEFCKRIIHIQKIILHKINTGNGKFMWNEFYNKLGQGIDINTLSKNDGFDDEDEFKEWFADYKDGVLACLHFTDFRY
jgi:hypothetical protein